MRPENNKTHKDKETARLEVELAMLTIESMDPFAGPLESPELHDTSMGLYEFFKDKYAESNIDLNYVGINGMENPLDMDGIGNNPLAYAYLQSRKGFPPHKNFLEEMNLDPSNSFNYEPHYLNNLMMHHPQQVQRALWTTYYVDVKNGWNEEMFRWVNEQVEEGNSGE